MDRFREDKEAFKKDMLAYKAAKAEFDAAGDLKLAREFYDANKIDVANRRFREIIAAFPTTQAAKDAKLLLDGDYVAARKMPANPIRPVEPLEPTVSWPQPPEPVAVVYPPDPEAVALAEAVRNAEAATSGTGPSGTGPNSVTSGIQPISVGAHNGSKTVHVEGYFNKKGTYVQPYNRSEPGTAPPKKH